MRKDIPSIAILCALQACELRVTKETCGNLVQRFIDAERYYKSKKFDPLSQRATTLIAKLNQCTSVADRDKLMPKVKKAVTQALDAL
jgi:hypothetical protein